MFKNFVSNLLMEKLLPSLVSYIFDIIASPLHKDTLQLYAFKDLKVAINEETKEIYEEKRVTYPHYNNLCSALQGALRTFVNYIEPSFEQYIFPSVSPHAVIDICGAWLVEKLQYMALLDLVLWALEKGLPELNPGGSWVRKEHRIPSFEAVPFQYPITNHDLELIKAANEEQAANVHNQLEKVVSEIGQSIRGLAQLSGLTSVNQESVNNGWLQLGVNTAKNLSKNVVLTTGYVMGMNSKVQKAVSTVFQKMQKPIHNALFYKSTLSALEFLKV